MPYDDPFNQAGATEEDAPAEAPTTTDVVKDSVSVQHSTDGISATFKFGGAYSDPWVVVKGADAGEVEAKLRDPKFKSLMELVSGIAKHYGPAEKPAGNGGGNQGGGGGGRAPQGAKEAPGGEKQYCEHGEMEFKSGISKAGNNYALFSCTAPRDQQCKPKYPKK